MHIYLRTHRQIHKHLNSNVTRSVEGHGFIHACTYTCVHAVSHSRFPSIEIKTSQGQLKVMVSHMPVYKYVHTQPFTTLKKLNPSITRSVKVMVSHTQTHVLIFTYTLSVIYDSPKLKQNATSKLEVTVSRTHAHVHEYAPLATNSTQDRNPNVTRSIEGCYVLHACTHYIRSY